MNDNFWIVGGFFHGADSGLKLVRRSEQYCHQPDDLADSEVLGQHLPLACHHLRTAQQKRYGTSVGGMACCFVLEHPTLVVDLRF